METVDLTPDYRVLARFMAQVLKENKFESDDARYEFSTEFQKVMAYLHKYDPEGWRIATNYNNRLADNA